VPGLFRGSRGGCSGLRGIRTYYGSRHRDHHRRRHRHARRGCNRDLDDWRAEREPFESIAEWRGQFKFRRAPDPNEKRNGVIREGLSTDGSGKVHGRLPNLGELQRMTRGALEDSQAALDESIEVRQAEQAELGEDGPHRARIGQEEVALRRIMKLLGE
jgi:hypothetical protein